MDPPRAPRFHHDEVGHYHDMNAIKCVQIEEYAIKTDHFFEIDITFKDYKDYSIAQAWYLTIRRISALKKH